MIDWRGTATCPSSFPETVPVIRFAALALPVLLAAMPAPAQEDEGWGTGYPGGKENNKIKILNF